MGPSNLNVEEDGAAYDHSEIFSSMVLTFASINLNLDESKIAPEDTGGCVQAHGEIRLIENYEF